MLKRWLNKLAVIFAVHEKDQIDHAEKTADALLHVTVPLAFPFSNNPNPDSIRVCTEPERRWVWSSSLSGQVDDMPT